jgi:hypothetical protein
VSEKNLDKMVFWENVRRAILPTIVVIAVFVGFLISGFNVVVNQEELHGTVIRNSIGLLSKSQDVIVTYIELENGRTIFVSLSAGATLPLVGSPVIVIRYIKKFFGDNFGLKQ